MNNLIEKRVIFRFYNNNDSGTCERNGLMFADGTPALVITRNNRSTGIAFEERYNEIYDCIAIYRALGYNITDINLPDNVVVKIDCGSTND